MKYLFYWKTQVCLKQKLNRKLYLIKTKNISIKREHYLEKNHAFFYDIIYFYDMIKNNFSYHLNLLNLKCYNI